MPYKDINKKQEYDRKWKRDHAEEERIRKIKWKKDNPEKVKASMNAYTLNNHEKEKNRKSIWRKTNPEKQRAAENAWAKKHPEKKLAQRHRRRARKLNAPGNGITGQQWKELLDVADGICTYCKQFHESLTMDHVIPLDRGGAHDISNIVPACRSCNSSKGTKLISEWRDNDRRK